MQIILRVGVCSPGYSLVCKGIVESQSGKSCEGPGCICAWGTVDSRGHVGQRVVAVAAGDRGCTASQRTVRDVHMVHGGDVHGKHTLTFASGALHTLMRHMCVQGSGAQGHKCHCPRVLRFHAFVLSYY